MPVKTVNLIAPGLFNSFHQSEIDRPVTGTRLLQKLIARSKHLRSLDANPIYRYHSELPLALYESINEQVEPDQEYSVIYLQPLHLELKSDHIVARSVDTVNSDYSAIINLLNNYYQTENLKFLQLKTGNIVCFFNHHKSVQFTPVSNILGRDIKHFLPDGKDSAYWISLFNELQMLLHENANQINQEQSGLNGFWLWGVSTVETNISFSGEYMGEVEWLNGFCKKNSLNKIDIKQLNVSDAETVTIIEEGFLPFSSSGDFSGWLKQFDEFNNNLLTSLYRALSTKKVQRIMIYDSENSAYEIKRSDRFRLFRKTPSINKICSISI